MINIQKCAIIGCGAVGATSAFSIVQSGMFSEMVLIDADSDKAQGEAMDLNHGLPFLQSMKIYAGDYSDLSDCYVIVITAGGAQRPNQTRLDLVKQNINIYKSIIPQIKAVNTECILLVVSNPVDILTYAAWKLSGFPKNKVIGSGTVLDSARLKYLMGEHLNVDSRSVHAFIIGEHGDSELVVWSSANVSGIDLNGFCNTVDGACERHDLEKIYNDVKNSAYEIIEKKGATYYAIALATTKILEAIVKNQHSVLPVSCYVDGFYGISDIFLGMPAILGRNGVEKELEIPLNIVEQQQLKSSAQKLRQVIDELEI